MRIAPPLTASEAEIDLGLELLDAAIERTTIEDQRIRELRASVAYRSAAK